MRWLSHEAKIKVYSVDEITIYIKDTFEKDKILQSVRVKGEISNFRHHNKKHMYFDLKDEQAIIHCAMFQITNSNLGFEPKDGVEVIVKGYVDIYKKKGEYQIIVEQMQLAGEGALYLKFLQLKEKLEKEGLFWENFKKPIPKIPRTIGIVTSLDGAAIKDIIKTIEKRFPHVNLIIYPSLVQGTEAKYSIERGIEALNQLKVEVIILARGGGSFEDLWSFNEENVARAIFKSRIPIITGIGHETDITIADFVADKRAHTPSAAAEIAVPDIIEIKNQLLNFKRRLNRNLIMIRENYEQRLNYLKTRQIFRRPISLIEQYFQALDDKEKDIIRIFINENEFLKKDTAKLGGKLNALSPTGILGRGYSITMKGNKIVKSIKDIKEKDIVLTILTDGNVRSRIE